jgi:hypothetical protein
MKLSKSIQVKPVRQKRRIKMSNDKEIFSILKNLNHEDRPPVDYGYVPQPKVSNPLPIEMPKIITPTEVRIVDIHMPFRSMIEFEVKWALAAIPALIVLVFLFAMFGGFIAGLLKGLAG